MYDSSSECVRSDARQASVSPDAFDADNLAYDPIPGTVRVAPSDDGRRVSVRYVAWDSYPPDDYWADGMMGTLSKDEVSGSFPVDRDADGRHRVAPRGQGQGTAGWYLPPFTPSGSFLSEAASLEGARDRLAGYDAWRAGELCGIVVETFLVDDSGTLSPLDQQATWSRDSLGVASRAIDDMAASLNDDLPAPDF